MLKEFNDRAAEYREFEGLIATSSKFKFSFHNHFHPFIGDLISKLKQGGFTEMLSIDTQNLDTPFFLNEYSINSNLVSITHEAKEVDIDISGAYSIYNWELFYHIPITIAVHLSNNQRFAEAQKWFHFTFDPTTDEPVDEAAGDIGEIKRYWKFKYFREKEAESITQLFEKLNGNLEQDDNLENIINEINISINEWKDDPFQPHTVARNRPLAYQFNVVMKYLDNLIAWGDSLFRQYTIETINEATQLYVLASSILGEKPQEVPRLYDRQVKTYNQIKDDLDSFGNMLDIMECELPMNYFIPDDDSDNSSRNDSLFGAVNKLYFCIPVNKKLLEYWNIVEDRLYKIRHCLDIEGIARPLSLFQPEIDPGMLVKGAAAGLDLANIVTGINQPVSNVRFTVILQKALELCSELKSMGNSLLSAIEKGDNEKLSLIRQDHELTLLKLSKDVKYLQWKDSEASIESLLKTRESAYQRYMHYQLLLGKEKDDFSDLESITIEKTQLTEDNIEDYYEELVGKYEQNINLEEYREEKLGLVGEVASKVSGITGAVDSTLGVGSSEHLQLNKTEDVELNVFMPLATSLSLFSGLTGAASTFLSLIPQFEVSLKPLGLGAATFFGGEQISRAVSAYSQLIRLGADIMSYQGTRASKLASYKRRIDDWVLQNNLAIIELQQIGKQIIGALLREQIAKKEFETQEQQILHSEDIQDFLTNSSRKFSNEGLYLWMQGELSKLYHECYKMAYDVAKKAEVTMKHELMREEINTQDFIKYNYWDNGRKGLLSGEALFMDLKRMELAYLESNKREFEITKHVSLKQLDPAALLSLKATGKCQVELPEWLFDLDCPGHYMRRIKSVSISIPCITGPYTGINCKLSLLKSKVRKTPIGDVNYDTNEEDERYTVYYGAIQSIVTSNAQNDSGMFEVNYRDERYLPFEGAGVISRWQLELPDDFRQFDYNTISDIIIHLNYTAREGGEKLKKESTDSLTKFISGINGIGFKRIFSLKHDFQNEWHKFKSSGSEPFLVTLIKQDFHYLAQAFEINITKIELFALENNVLDNKALLDTSSGAITLNDNDIYELSINENDPYLEKKEVSVVIEYTLIQ